MENGPLARGREGAAFSHPGIVKTDCIVLGTSSLIHGALEQDIDLDGRTETGEAPTKTCPACKAEIPLAATECSLCGEAFPREAPDAGEGGTATVLSGPRSTC